MNSDTFHKITQVAKNTRFTALKDKILLVGIVSACLVIGLCGLLPKHKAHKPLEHEEQQESAHTLSQNMELIAKLKENSKLLTLKSPEKHTIPTVPLTISYRHALTKETLARMNSPATFFSIGGSDTPVTDSKQAINRTLTGRDTNSAFLNQQNDIASVSAKQLPHPTLTVPAGEMIPATLETAINSELAGMARAITTRDIYALSGNKLLIPKGSTLVGQFNAGLTQGQSRVFIVWDRVQLSNGIIVTLNSPNTDDIGRSGQSADYIDRHFFERFGNGVLFSVLGAYTAIGGVHDKDEYNSLSQYRMNIASSFQQAANQSLQQDMQNKPTLQINQGASINVFVAHDLDFSPVASRL